MPSNFFQNKSTQKIVDDIFSEVTAYITRIHSPPKDFSTQSVLSMKKIDNSMSLDKISTIPIIHEINSEYSCENLQTTEISKSAPKNNFDGKKQLKPRLLIVGMNDPTRKSFIKNKKFEIPKIVVKSHLIELNTVPSTLSP